MKRDVSELYHIVDKVDKILTRYLEEEAHLGTLDLLASSIIESWSQLSISLSSYIPVLLEVVFMIAWSGDREQWKV